MNIENKKLLLIILLALLPRLLLLHFAIQNNELYEPDSTGYRIMASAIAKGDFLFQKDKATQSIARISEEDSILTLPYQQ
jgi:hypothetical protein